MTFKVKVWPLDKPYHRPAKFKRTHTLKKCLEELCIIELGNVKDVSKRSILKQHIITMVYEITN